MSKGSSTGTAEAWPQRVVALSGGIGGAKLALGLKRVLTSGALTVIANTGDDFEHLGLHVSPDIDTLVYTLAGINNPETGWGRRDESWQFMAAIGALGGETWFQLGDADLAMHVMRTQRLARGDALSTVTADVCRALDVGTHVLPMSDDAVRTRIRAETGWLDFQDYFVRQQSRPVVREITYDGAEKSTPAAGVIEALTKADAVVLCPSNPLISIEPILAVPGIRDAIAQSPAPAIAISPIIAGQAVKGPTAKMLTELGLAPTAATVLARYQGLIDAFIADPRDAAELSATGVSTVEIVAADVMMQTIDDRERVARCALDAAARLHSTTLPCRREVTTP